MANEFGDDVVETSNTFGDAAVTSPYAAISPNISKGRQFAQKIAQGATFGFGDEISAGIVGATAKLMGGEFKDAYNYALRNIRSDEAEFGFQNPKTALGSELAGAILTGGMTGSRALAAPRMANMSSMGRIGTLAAVGGTEGALYGAGTGTDDRGERALTGLLIGAVAAPVAAKVMDLAIRGVGATASYVGRKLSDTPRDQAIRAIRRAAEMEGIDADDAVRMMDQMGPQATLADLGENFRSLARGASDQAGAFKTEARNMLNQRQLAQQERLLAAAEVASGQRAGNFNVARQSLIEGRKAAAAPLYESAFLQDVALNPELARVLQRPDMASALNKAARLAANEGDDVGTNLLKRIHYAKMQIDDQIGAAIRSGSSNRARILTTLKNDLLAQVDQLSPDYRQARQIFSSDSRMINAMDEGLNLFKYSADEMKEAMDAMSKSEQDLFRLGAVRAIKDQLETTGMTHDATRRLINTRSMRDKLGMILPDPEEFIKKALTEAEFSRTREIITQGSRTSQNLAGQADLKGAIQTPGLINDLASGDPVAAGRALLGIFTKKEVSPEVVNELATTMLQRGVTPAQVRRTFAIPAFRRSIGNSYERVVLPTLSGSIGTATGAIIDE